MPCQAVQRRSVLSSQAANARDLSRAQYEALHDGRFVAGLDAGVRDEFIIDRVGRTEDRHFQDYGIEYYRYTG